MSINWRHSLQSFNFLVSHTPTATLMSAMQYPAEKHKRIVPNLVFMPLLVTPFFPAKPILECHCKQWLHGNTTSSNQRANSHGALNGLYFWAKLLQGRRLWLLMVENRVIWEAKWIIFMALVFHQEFHLLDFYNLCSHRQTITECKDTLQVCLAQGKNWNKMQKM